VRAPHPAHFLIIYAAPADFLIRVWVPRKYAGQPYTRPRVNGQLSSEKESPERFLRRILLSGTRETEAGENGPPQKISAPRSGYYRNGPGEQAMTTENDQTTEKKSGSAMRPVLDGILNAVRATPRRMPAGGWFREVTTSENWRTTTIVQRHRDRASSTPPS